ncbi:MAG: fructose-6-phosphate aldolase [Solobacterium sp.]|nr:fructose-6-phosphate aldolase [Solobacterium sp.]
MKLLIDTADLSEIEEAVHFFPIDGVTCNPSIIKKSAPEKFFPHVRKMRSIIGRDRTLHIQVVAEDSETQLKEAERLFREVDEDVYIKVPVTLEGLRTIRILRENGHHVTATAVYDLMQAYMAMHAGAEYIAVYYNRVVTLGGDANELIRKAEERIAIDDYPGMILGASFHSVGQVRECIACGAGSLTVPLSLLKATYANRSISGAVSDFTADWESLYGKGTNLLNVE